jgi:hypothetical protein
MKAERPSIDAYMAKLDGKRAAEAWNMPGLKTMIIRNSTPIRGFSVLEMAEKSFVSHAAQMKARAMRIK